MTTKQDFTPTGLKVQGPYENDRNTENTELFKRIIKEAYGVTDVICAHHLTYVQSDRRKDGFEYQVVEEIPSADTLIFDHDVARCIWGEDYCEVLKRLAVLPCEQRDRLLAELYYGRPGCKRIAD